MVELKIRCGCLQVPALHSVSVDPSSSPSPVKMPSHGEGEVQVPTLTPFRTGTCEYPHLISSSTIYLSLSNASENFQRDLKSCGPRCSLVSMCSLPRWNHLKTDFTERFLLRLGGGGGACSVFREPRSPIGIWE